MESSPLPISYTKIAIGLGFALFGGLYTFYYYFKSQTNKYSKYIDDYLHEISTMLCNSNGNFDECVLCHINYVKNEIINHLRNKSHNNQIDVKRRSSLMNEQEYNQLLKETNTINNSYQIEAIEYIKSTLEPFDISSSLNYLLLIQDKLIDLPQNKNFEKLIQYPSIELPQRLTNEQIDDSFFFASVNQIEYDKLLSKYYEAKKSNEEIQLAIQLQLFKQRFKDEFYNKYGYNCKYITDLVLNKDGLNAKKLSVLINKVTY